MTAATAHRQQQVDAVQGRRAPLHSEPLWILRYPWVVRIPISGPPTTPNATAWLERGLQCLGDTGLGENQKLSVTLLVSGFVRNYATVAANLAVSFLASSAPQEAMSNYGRLLARLTDAQRFPALHAAIASGAFDEPDDPDGEFVFGLERILDGIDDLIRART